MSVETEGIGKRLKELRKKLCYTQDEFAKLIGVSRSGWANYEIGKTQPPETVFMLLGHKFGASAEWLKSGVGEMFAELDEIGQSNRERALAEICREVIPNAGDFGRRLVKALARLSVSDWEVLQRVAADIAANDPETAGGPETETGTEVQRAQGKVVPLFRTTLYNEGVSAGTGNYVDDASAESIDLTQEPPRGTDYVLRVSGDSMIPDYPPGCLVYVKIASRVEYGQVGIFSIYGEMYIKRFTRRGLESLNPDYDLIPLQSGMICQGLVLGVVPESIA